MGKSVDITILIGDNWEQEFLWKYKSTGLPVPTDGWTADLELFSSAGTEITTVTVTYTLTSATGSILAAMTKTETAKLTAQTGSYKLHLNHTATGTRWRLAWGQAVMVA